MCIRVSTSPQKHHTPFFCQAPLKSENCPILPFLGNSPLHIVFFFYEQTATPLEKVSPSFPATALSKLRSCQAPPFWKFGRRLNPPPPLPPSAEWEEVHTMVYKPRVFQRYREHGEGLSQYIGTTWEASKNEANILLILCWKNMTFRLS